MFRGLFLSELELKEFVNFGNSFISLIRVQTKTKAPVGQGHFVTNYKPEMRNLNEA